MSLNVLAFGASRNIGYYTCLRLLDAGANVTFLLRKPEIFDNDPAIQKYVKSGTAHIVKGDALVKNDVQEAWAEASKENDVDILLFTIGGVPTFSLTKGLVVDVRNLTTQSMLNVLSTMPQTTQTPRTIVVSSTGLSRASHESIPLLLRPLYSMIEAPLKDKVGLERVVSHCAGWSWNSKDLYIPEGEEIMGAGDLTKTEGLLEKGALPRVLLVQPSILTDGDCLADVKRADGKAPYRVSETPIGGWTVSRKDVGHFITNAILNQWDDFEGKRVEISY